MDLRGNREVELISLSGEIELTVPQNLGMNVDIELAYTNGNAGRYSIQSDFPFKTEETKEWEYEGRTARKYIHGAGKVGSGQHLVRIRTINGNVILKKSS
ncbi:MAG TPA: hypothetical protein VJ521_10920 [Acidobacteriota bacterium]|nr:hypothetical protein [Acidobacteriota bacterium]